GKGRRSAEQAAAYRGSGLVVTSVVVQREWAIRCGADGFGHTKLHWRRPRGIQQLHAKAAGAATRGCDDPWLAGDGRGRVQSDAYDRAAGAAQSDLERLGAGDRAHSAEGLGGDRRQGHGDIGGADLAGRGGEGQAVGQIDYRVDDVIVVRACLELGQWTLHEAAVGDGTGLHQFDRDRAFLLPAFVPQVQVRVRQDVFAILQYAISHARGARVEEIRVGRQDGLGGRYQAPATTVAIAAETDIATDPGRCRGIEHAARGGARIIDEGRRHGYR